MFEKTKKAQIERGSKAKNSPPKNSHNSFKESPSSNRESKSIPKSNNAIGNKENKQNNKKSIPEIKNNDGKELSISYSQRMKPMRGSQRVEKMTKYDEDDDLNEKSLLENSIIYGKNSPDHEEKTKKSQNFNQKIKASLLISLILIRRSMKNSALSKKASVFMKWIRFSLAKEKELVNEELKDFNIILSEIVCKFNEKTTKLRLKKNDLDSRINMLSQMITCLKVNIFQKNIKKFK